MKKTFTRCTLSLLLGIFTLAAPTLLAQNNAALSVQGVLTKSDGTAVDDGEYDMTFKLWTSPGGGQGSMEHNETILKVPTTGGVYSVVLGQQAAFPINAQFLVPYYLGVSVGGGGELLPRPRLTHAPYALALLGQNNTFPSTGAVTADAINVNGAANITGAATAAAFVAASGAPASPNAGKGYSFGTGGDMNGGLFSPGNDTVSVYTNAVERVRVTNSQVEMISADLKLNSGKSIKYSDLTDWRLVDVDDFTNSTDGWNAYSTENNNVVIANGVKLIQTSDCYPLTGGLLTKNDIGSGDVDNLGRYHLKKSYDLNNTPHTKIKVIYTISTCSNGGAEDYSVFSLAGEDLTDLDNYERLLEDDTDAIGSNRQITRELILNTSLNTFAFGFAFKGYEDTGTIFPVISPRFIDWSLDNIEIWVK